MSLAVMTEYITKRIGSIKCYVCRNRIEVGELWAFYPVKGEKEKLVASHPACAEESNKGDQSW